MLKRLASLFLSLLVCLSLLPGQARAAEMPGDPMPPVILEPLDPEAPEEPLMPLSGEESGTVPPDKDVPHN